MDQRLQPRHSPSTPHFKRHRTLTTIGNGYMPGSLCAPIARGCSNVNEDGRRVYNLHSVPHVLSPSTHVWVPSSEAVGVGLLSPFVESA